MPETYQEKMARVTMIPEAYKNDPKKGHAGARGSRSVFPVSNDTQAMVMFIEAQSKDANAVREALLIIGVNNNVTEAQQTYTLVSTTAANPSNVTVLHLKPIVVDEIEPGPSAITFEKVRLAFREGRILEMEGEEDTGLRIQAAQNAIAKERFKVDLLTWSLRQLKDGTGPMMATGGGGK